MEEVSQAIVSALLANGDEGRRFDDAVLRDAVPVLLLSIADQVDTRALPGALLRMVDDFLDRAEANHASDPAQVTAAIGRYLEAHPLPVTLWSTIERVLEEHAASLGDDAVSRLRDFARFSGAKPAAPHVEDAAPEGTERGGLLLRAKLHKKDADS